MFGGAALNEQVGDSLAAQGVSLYTIYGATEVGMISTCTRREHPYTAYESHTSANRAPANPGMDWVYWSVTAGLKTVFRPIEDGTYEVVILVSAPSQPSARARIYANENVQSEPDVPLPVLNTKVDGQDAYSMNDLAVPHPTRPGLWRIVGRADEQIVLSNGEKTNPVPLGQFFLRIPLQRLSNTDNPHLD